MAQQQADKGVRIWLLVGLVMVFIQVMLGGVTRLTGSGLSITEWDVIMGILPPLNTAEWQEVFHKYQQFGQYKLVNTQMDLHAFKQIFFWEWFHRLWARSMGFVFLIPLIYFIIKGKIAKNQIVRYGILLVLGGLAGVVGWLMVSTGLKDNKVLVSPISLMSHLLVACCIFIYLFRLWLEDTYPKSRVRYDTYVRRLTNFLVLFIIIQIALGGLVAGSKAALASTTWPTMNGSFIPNTLGFKTPFEDHIFENNLTIQFIHRMVAYFIFFFSLFYYWTTRNVLAKPIYHTFRNLMLIAVFTQVSLGIFTLLNTRGEVPVILGTAHQLVAFLFLNTTIGLHYFVKYRAISSSSMR